MSTNTTVSFDTLLTIDEVCNTILTCGSSITPIVQSEPGCGKSSILWMLRDILGEDEYDYIYVDCPDKQYGDMGACIPVHSTKSLEFYVGALIKPGSTKKKVIMLDEFLKTPKMMKIIFTRLMLERCIGEYVLPADSIVFATSNNQSDGVNDSIEGHVGNRVMMLRMQKPDAIRWNLWATANRIAAPIRAWVAMNQRCLHSYLDGGEEDNPFIFNPTNSVISYVSPRSLAKSDVIVRKRSRLGENATKAALAGTIGASAAESMSAFLSMEKEILSTKEVLANPMGVVIPQKPAALFMMMFNALDDLLTQDDLDAFMKFIERVGSRELESVFFTMLIQNNRTVRIAKNNKAVSQWAAANLELF
jgi:hypothetical protein